MAQLARDVMTAEPACCTPETTLDEVARLMLENDCGEIPVINRSDQPVGVVTDRDIVCRVVAEGKNPTAHTAGSCMTRPVLTVSSDTPIDEVFAVMESHQIRRVPVVDEDGCCAGIISQADLAEVAPSRQTAELLSQISRDSFRWQARGPREQP
jgi:CBS domain-containing protein